MSSTHEPAFIRNACDIFSLTRLIFLFSQERSFKEGNDEIRLLNFADEILDNLIIGSNMIIERKEGDKQEFIKKIINPSINTAFELFLQVVKTEQFGKQTTSDIADNISKEIKIYKENIAKSISDKTIYPEKFAGLVKLFEDLARNKIKENNQFSLKSVLI